MRSCSQVWHPLGLGVVGGMAVVLALGGLEEPTLGIGIGGHDDLGGDDPDGGSLVAAGVEVAGVAQRHGGVSCVQGACVDMGEATGGADEHFPHGPGLVGHDVSPYIWGGLGSESGGGRALAIRVGGGRLADPGTIVECLTTALPPLDVAGALALDDGLELIPVELAVVVVAALLIPLQVRVLEVETPSLRLRNDHVDEALTQLIVAETLDLPFHGLLGVRG